MSLVYISSTFQDLKAERRAAYEAVRRLRHDAIAMEDYVAADQRPLDRCLADVRRSDIYVGLLGWRYGYVPPGRTRSITELEFREAVKGKKPCLLFLQDSSVKSRLVSRDDRKHIERLRASIGRNYLASFFTTPDDLAAKVTAAVANVFGEVTEAIGRLDMPLNRVIGELRKLAATPKLTPDETIQEVDNLQRDAMNWVHDRRSVRTAQLRLDQARRLIADASDDTPRNAALITLRGYVEKTAAQIAENQADSRGAKQAYAAAARYFRAAHTLDPTDVAALNGQVDIHLAHKEFGKAATLGRVITAYRPDYTAAFWDLAIALRGLLGRGRKPALIRELADVYERLVQLIPKEPSGFTPADLASAQADAQMFRALAKRH